MKRFTWIILSVICLFWLVACGNFVTESSDTQVSETTDMNIKENDISNMIKEDSEKQESTVNVNTNQENEIKAAVVYFSATGNTKVVAELIANETKADIYEIVPTQEYTDEDLNYNDDSCRANLEMNDESARPAIKNDLSGITKYDVIYLGYPIWWGTCPRIIQTFLESYDISGAKIYTFCTSGSSGIEKSISDLKTLYPNVNIVDGKRFNSGTKADIKGWIESIE